MEQNANYMYLFEMTYKYAQEIINFRMAIRQNNRAHLNSGKWMTKVLFHGRSHTIPRSRDL